MEKFQILGRSRGGILSPGLHLHLFLEFAAKASYQQVIGDRGGHGHGLTVHTKDQHHIILTAFPSYFPTFSQL